MAHVNVAHINMAGLAASMWAHFARIDGPRPMGADADVARASMKARAVAFEMPASKGPRIDGGPGPTGAIGA